MSRAHIEAPVSAVRAQAYKGPTDKREARVGTFTWDHTVRWSSGGEVDEGGGERGLGYTYSDASISGLIEKTLGTVVEGADALDPPKAWNVMVKGVRNLGREGLAATAISAVDAAIWDLKAKLLDVPIAVLLCRVRDAVPIYGSGGFTTYTDNELRAQLSGWVDRDGCRDVKIKIGTDPSSDPHWRKVAKEAIGEARLFVDANGAFLAKQGTWLRGALRRAEGLLVRGACDL